jgi:MoxR-like ATPase
MKQAIPEAPEKAAKFFSDSFQQIKDEISKTVVGQKDVIDQLLISLFSRGHCVLIGVPGLAKTLLIQTLAQTLNLSFSRIQFTPDLMPGDITGTEVIEDEKDTGRKQFRFIKGPIFANIVLADEINRTPPKTQAALLEGMQEYNITASGQTFAGSTNRFLCLLLKTRLNKKEPIPCPRRSSTVSCSTSGSIIPHLEEEKTDR